MLTVSTALFATLFALCACVCICAFLWAMQRLASNLLQGWDLDNDGKVEVQEMIYVLDEFCGELCFECRCPNIHSQKMSVLSGCLGVLETITQVAVLYDRATCRSLAVAPSSVLLFSFSSSVCTSNKRALEH